MSSPVHPPAGETTRPCSEPVDRPSSVRSSTADPKRIPRRRLLSLMQGHHMLALADQVVVSATNLATNLLVVWSCTDAEFGVYVLTIALLHFTKGIQEQLVASPYAIKAQRLSPRERASFTGSSVVHQFVTTCGLLLIVGLVGVAVQIGSDSNRLHNAMLVLLMVVPFFAAREYIRRLGFANFQFRTVLAIDGGLSIVQLSFLSCLLAFGHLHVVPTFAIIASVSLLGVVIWTLLRRVPVCWDRERWWPDWVQNWKFGRWAVVTMIVGCSAPFFMPWLVAAMRGEANAGGYGACQTLVGLANMLIVGMGNFLSPLSARIFVEQGTAGLNRVLKKAVMFFGVTLGLFCLVLLFCGESVADLLFDSKFPDLGWPLVWLGVGQLMAAVGVVAGNGLWAIDAPRQNLVADVVTFLVTLSCAVWWIPTGGILGAALAVWIGNSMGALCRWLILWQILKSF